VKGFAQRIAGATVLVLGLLVALPPAIAQSRTAAKAPTELVGTVLRVGDGDSLTIEPAGGAPPIVVRLYGIDAPEVCQPWGLQSRDALAERLVSRQVHLVVKGRDDFGRTLATVRLDGVDIGERQVRDGNAWSYRYKHDNGPYVAQERMARALGRGLHAQPGAVMPRDFRRTHGPCGAPGESPAAPAAAASRTPPVVPAAVPSAATTALPGSGRAAPARRCDGRTRCSQMTSCDEATWFLRHCPGVEMDGNGDGVPCERQWCAR
jgi:endonuclease YncB( thermonuclease family)